MLLGAYSCIENLRLYLTVRSGAEPKGELNLKTDFQGYSVFPEAQRLDGMHGIELKFTSRYTKHIVFDAAPYFL